MSTTELLLAELTDSIPVPVTVPSPLLLARLIALDYLGTLNANVMERLDIAGVQSLILMVGDVKTLLIRGTNERRDWLYNLDFRHDSYDVGDTWKWHNGFLNHARIAYAFAKGKGVQLVVGHSLGAAAMQIVASSLGVPGVGFASPRALFGLAAPPTGRLITNYCRPDDIVTGLPFGGLGFNHCGEARWLDPHGRHLGGDHGIVHYIELLEILEDMTPKATPSNELIQRGSR